MKTTIIQKLVSNETIHKGLKPHYGIALFAIDKGYESLSNKQKYYLKSFLNPQCEGDGIDECRNKLSDEEHFRSLDEVLFYKLISCGECLNQIEHYKRFQ